MPSSAARSSTGTRRSDLQARAQWHTFWNAGDQPARILEIISPAGFERFFEELTEPGPADPARRSTLAAQYGLELDLDSIPGLVEEHGLSFGPSQ